MSEKLRDEVKKFDTLLHERLILDEKLRLLKEDMALDSEKVEEQKEYMAELKQQNDENSATLEETQTELTQ